MSSATQISLPLDITGHCKIVDDLGNVLLDKYNAIHPQNMARVIARALANEPHSSIYRIAFGNGGTLVDAAFTVSYKPPNDGQSPDIATWDSRIYNETYSEIIDEGQTALNPLLGTDPGSADLNTGARAGGGAVPSSDPVSVPHVSGPGVRSNELGLISEVVINCTLNGNEPRGQFANDSIAVSTESDFVFDEIGLYTNGAAAINTSGFHQIAFGTVSKTSEDDTGLLAGQTYSFNIAINGGSAQVISFTVPIAGGSGTSGQVLYGDLCEAFNTNNPAWNILPSAPSATFLITDLTGGTFPSIVGAQTSGYLQVQSNTSGASSQINLTGTQTTAFLSQLNPPSGAQLLAPVQGENSGVQNAPVTPSTQRERLLTHLIFAPVLKTANRTLAITYTITISVARSIQL
jgi:hypothetical protein